MQSKKILITGGAGFVGSQLGHRLHKQGHEVVLLDNMSFGHLDNLLIDGEFFGQFVVGDVRGNARPEYKANALEEHMAGVDTVFHFAGVAPLPVCQANPGMAFEINTAAVSHVLETARRAGVRRVLFSSTSAVYENSAAATLREDTPAHPDLVYATTKLHAEQVCASFCKNYGMDVLTVRFFNLYGPHQDFKRKSPPLTSYIARELAADRAPKLFNKSDAKRDYVYIDDVVDLLLLMMASTKTYSGDVFNAASGIGYSVPEIYAMMSEISGKKLAPSYGDPGGFWDAYQELFSPPFSFNRERIVKEVFKSAIGDTERTFREFGWRATTSMQDGLANVYRYAAEGRRF